MNNSEALKILPHMMGAGSEWDDALNVAISAINYTSSLSNQNSCNNCGVLKQCEIKPPWGENVRINCYKWKPKISDEDINSVIEKLRVFRDFICNSVTEEKIINESINLLKTKRKVPSNQGIEE